MALSCASLCVGSCSIEPEPEPETSQERTALRTGSDPAPAGPTVLDEADSATAGESWGQSIWAYVEWDARRAHRHPESGTIVMNRPGYRWFYDDGQIALTSTDVEVADTEEVIHSDTRDGRWGVGFAVDDVQGAAGPQAAAEEQTSVEIDDTTVTIRHGDRLIERYENKREGIEQRFVLLAGEPGTVTIGGRIAGFEAEVRQVPDGLILASRGRDRIFITNPVAVDAHGNSLDCSFTAAGDQIAIQVRGALAYPIAIDPYWYAIGDGSGISFGNAVASAGDVNDDGYDDIVVGAPYYDTSYSNAGKAYLFLGSSKGMSTSADWTSVGNDTAGANFGFAVASACDQNQDGHADVIVGAPNDKVTYFTRGRIYVYHGNKAGLDSSPAVVISGTQDGERLGWSLDCAGLVNGDSFADVIVGSPYYDDGATDNGRACIYFGSSAGITPSNKWCVAGATKSGARFGFSVSAAGNVDGDSGFPDFDVYSDVIIGAPYLGQGAAFIYCGDETGPSTTPCWTGSGEGKGAAYGYSVAGAGDVDNAADDDWLVGSPGYSSDNGKVYLYYAGGAQWSQTGQGGFGASVSRAGDVNGDDYADFLVGAPDEASGDGKAYLYLGSGADPSSNWQMHVSGAGAGTGVVAAAGNVNGDGDGAYDDIIIGSPEYSMSTGRVDLFLGTESTTGICDEYQRDCNDRQDCTYGDMCNLNLVCEGTDYSCDDSDECTTDICYGDGTCSYTPVECDDGLSCNGVESCDPQEGCVPGEPIDCTDEYYCTQDHCIEPDPPDYQCWNPPDPTRCEDYNECVDDACDPANSEDSSGCVYLEVPDGTACTEACVENGTCQNGDCIGDAVECTGPDPDNYCYYCDEATGCVETIKADDLDCDSIPNEQDNCPEVHNPLQQDYNFNGIGEACEVDYDGDGVSNDNDGDGVWFEDVCSSGQFENCDDNCPLVANPNQEDADGDGIGDACEPDADGDQYPDDGWTASHTEDNCRYVSNPGQIDQDGDGVGDQCDNCVGEPNSDQANLDGDSLGDACDLDDDGDDIPDDVDNCPTKYNPLRKCSDDSDCIYAGGSCELIMGDLHCTAQLDSDRTGDPQVPDPDGIGDVCDNCPLVNNPGQQDSDGNGVGDACGFISQEDIDGDGVPNQAEYPDLPDNCPYHANPGQEDSDGDLIGDVCDTCTADPSGGTRDSDGDCPDMPFTQPVSCGNACDLDGDIDGDGIPDLSDKCPEMASKACSTDFECEAGTCNGDGHCSDHEDEDGDGVGDLCDYCPNESNPRPSCSVDQDCTNQNAGFCIGGATCSQQPWVDELPLLFGEPAGNGTHDDCDPDYDFDGVPNEADDPNDADNCPATANAYQIDRDEDGVGDACDDDIDGDLIPNQFDPNNPSADLDPCPLAARDQCEDDSDCPGVGNTCDAEGGRYYCTYEPDLDGDNIPDYCDNCRYISNGVQEDLDEDGIGDVCDDDIDGDRLENGSDVCPRKRTGMCIEDSDCGEDSLGNPIACNQETNYCDEAPDNDNDGLGDNCDICPTIPSSPDEGDRDNDGIGDSCDACPDTYDPTNELNADGKGVVCTDTDGDGLVDWEENNTGGDGELTDPLSWDSDGDGAGDGEEYGMGTNPNNDDTDGDGTIDSEDEDPIENIGDPPSVIYVRIDSISMTSRPYDEEAFPSVDFAVSGKETGVVARRLDDGKRLVYGIDKKSTDNDNLVTLSDREYTVSGPVGDNKHVWEKKTHVISVPKQLNGNKKNGSGQWNFNVTVYWTGIPVLDRHKIYDEDGNLVADFDDIALFNYLGQGHISNPGLDTDEEPYALPGGWRYSFAVPAASMAALGAGAVSELKVSASGDNSDRNTRDSWKVRQSARLTIQAAHFSRMTRIPPRVVSTHDDDGRGPRFMIRIPQEIAQTCDSHVRLKLIENGSARANFEATGGNEMDLPKGAFEDGLELFELRGGYQGQQSSNPYDTIEIIAKCRGDSDAERIAREGFHVAALPKNFYIEQENAPGICSSGYLGSDLMVGPAISWWWESDSGNTSDLNKVVIYEKYSIGMCINLPSGVIQGENTRGHYMPNSPDFRGIINPQMLPNGRTGELEATGNHRFSCKRTGNSGDLSFDALRVYYFKYPTYFRVTAAENGFCIQRCSAPGVPLWTLLMDCLWLGL